MRIASLLSGATEVVCALGAGDRLVARSHECDRPAGVEALPVVSRPTFDVTGTSAEIDARVRGRLRSGQPLFEIDGDLLARLAPDLLLTQTQCEVCAVGPADLQRATDVGPRQLVALQAGTIEGVLAGFLEIADALDLAAKGERLVAGLRADLARTAEKVRSLRRPTVVCIEWIDPVFVAANWTAELVAAAGGVHLGRGPGRDSATTAWDEVRAADPEVLIVAPCGFGLERTRREMPTLVGRPGWPELRAVREGRVFLADGNVHFNRSGLGLFETADVLAEILHPAEVPPEHRGSAWALYRQ